MDAIFTFFAAFWALISGYRIVQVGAIVVAGIAVVSASRGEEPCVDTWTERVVVGVVAAAGVCAAIAFVWMGICYGDPVEVLIFGPSSACEVPPFGGATVVQ